MAAHLSPNAKQQFFTLAGAPAAGYKLYTYAPGTTTPQATYSDRAAAVSNANPVILNARGEATIYLTRGLVYDYALKSAAEVQEWLQPGVASSTGDGSEVQFVQSGAGSVVRDVQAKSQERLSVLDKIPVSEHAAIKAKTSTLDVAAYFNIALAQAAADGRDVFVPSGKYKLTSGLVISELGDTDDYNPRGALIGEGPSNTIFEFGVGNYTGITIEGGTGSGSHANLRTGGFSLQKTDRLGIGLSMDNIAYFAVRDIFASGWQYGTRGTDILTGKFERCTWRNNDYGIQAYYGNGSSPNAITFDSCEFGINKYGGCQLIGPGSVTFIGGAVEGNGWVGGGVGYGIYAEDSGSESGVGLAIYGTYFEANEGVADVWLKSSAANTRSAAHDIAGANFARLSNTLFVTNNIRVENLSVARMTVSIGGCGFKKFGSYVADVSRQYINRINSSTGTVYINRVAGNYYMDAVENAEMSGISDSESSLPVAWGRFSVTGGGPVNLVETKNVASAAYIGTGDYTVTVTEGVTGASYCVQATAANATFCSINAYHSSATVIVVKCFDAAGVAMNPAGFSLEIKALRL